MGKQIKSGIYKITNIVNGKVYIGQSSNLKERWIKHKGFLKNENHHNAHLQYSWNKYGEDSFCFEIIEYCHEEKLDEREKYWICKYDSYNNGYNLDLGGKGIRGYKHTEEEILKMRRIQKPPIVLQFDLDFNLIRRWDGGVTHAHKELKITRQAISIRCRHLISPTMTPFKNSYWVYEDEYNSLNFTWENYLKNIPAVKIGSICKFKPLQQKIFQYDLNFNKIKEWNDLSELLDEGYDIDRIRLICNHTGRIRTHRNYVWAYENYDFSDGYFDCLHKSPKPSSKCR